MIYTILITFLHLLLDVLPYFIGALVFSAFLETKVTSSTLLNPFITGKFSIIWVSILGGLLPGCACATIPLAETLKQKKAGLGAISAFLMASPLLGPHTIILTYGFLGLRFTLWRIVAALLGAIVLGYFLQWCEKKGWIEEPSLQKKSCCSSSTCTSSSSHSTSFLNAFWNTLKNLGSYFLIGLFIASILTVVIPTQLIPTYIGSGLFAYVIAAFIGIPVYVCEGEEIPITKALLNLHLGVGPSFTFMMGAVGTCIPTLLMAKKIIGNKAVFIYSIYWFFFAILAGISFSVFN